MKISLTRLDLKKNRRFAVVESDATPVVERMAMSIHQ
jgi:hypothetical protein